MEPDLWEVVLPKWNWPQETKAAKAAPPNRREPIRWSAEMTLPWVGGSPVLACWGGRPVRCAATGGTGAPCCSFGSHADPPLLESRATHPGGHKWRVVVTHYVSWGMRSRSSPCSRPRHRHKKRVEIRHRAWFFDEARAGRSGLWVTGGALREDEVPGPKLPDYAITRERTRYTGARGSRSGRLLCGVALNGSALSRFQSGRADVDSPSLTPLIARHNANPNSATNMTG
jgi:hypothetical protein